MTDRQYGDGPASTCHAVVWVEPFHEAYSSIFLQVIITTVLGGHVGRPTHLFLKAR